MIPSSKQHYKTTFMTEQEIWKEIPGWEGYYSVSTYGRIKSEARIINEKRKEGWKAKKYTLKEMILKPSKDTSGHLRVSLSKNSQIKFKMIHALVLLAFVGEKPIGHECCHKDGDPTNNNLSNLYYGTRANNIADAKRHGTFPMGENRPGALLTPDKVKQIYNLCLAGASDSDIAKKYNVTKGCIVQIRLGKNWKEVTGGKPIGKSLYRFNKLTNEEIELILDKRKTTTQIGQLLKADRHTILKWRKKLLSQ